MARFISVPLVASHWISAEEDRLTGMTMTYVLFPSTSVLSAGSDAVTLLVHAAMYV